MTPIITIIGAAALTLTGLAWSRAMRRLELTERELRDARTEAAADRRALEDARQSLAHHRDARERQARSIADLQQLAERGQVDRAAVVGIDAMRQRAEEAERQLKDVTADRKEWRAAYSDLREACEIAEDTRDRALDELARRSPKHHVWHEGECLLCGARRDPIRKGRYTYWAPDGVSTPRAPECER